LLVNNNFLISRLKVLVALEKDHRYESAASK